MAAEHIMHMQKAPSEMNLQLHHVLSDITGVSGLKILDSILDGKRDPMRLASLCNWRVRSPREVVAKSLEGDYREEHLFALRQSLAGYRFYQSLITDVDAELETKTKELPSDADGAEEMPPRTKECRYHRAGNEPSFDLRSEMFRITGVDLTNVPDISALTAYTILMEIGPEVSRFRNASAFVSWLGLCPEKQVSGGKVLYSRSRKVKNRAAAALRLGAQGLYRSKNYLGQFHRRMKWRLGGPEAITATAHKLARIVYHMLSTKEPYSEDVLLASAIASPTNVPKSGSAGKLPTSATSSPLYRKWLSSTLFLRSSGYSAASSCCTTAVFVLCTFHRSGAAGAEGSAQ